MNKVFLISDKILDPKEVTKKIELKYGNYSMLSFNLSIHEEVIKFFDVSRTDYWSILESDKKNTPNTLFLIPINKAKELLGELTYKGSCPVDNMYPLTIKQAYKYVSEFIYKPFLGEDVFCRKAADAALLLMDLTDENVLLFNYNDYENQAKPFIRKFGKENVIIVESEKQL